MAFLTLWIEYKFINNLIDIIVTNLPLFLAFTVTNWSLFFLLLTEGRAINIPFDATGVARAVTLIDKGFSHVYVAYVKTYNNNTKAKRRRDWRWQNISQPQIKVLMEVIRARGGNINFKFNYFIILLMLMLFLNNFVNNCGKRLLFIHYFVYKYLQYHIKSNRIHTIKSFY